MGRTPMKMTPRQTSVLAELTHLNKKYREARRSAHEEAMRVAEEKIEAVRIQMDLKVRESFELGIPKSRIGKVGLGTTSPLTVNEALARTANQVAVVEELRAVKRVATLDGLHRWLKTRMFHFHTTPEHVLESDKFMRLAARPGFSAVGFMRALATTPAQEEFMMREGKFQPFEMAVQNRGSSVLVFVSDEFPQGRTEWFEWPGVDPAGNGNPEWAFLRENRTGSTEPNAKPGQLFVAWLAENGVPESLFTPVPQAAPAQHTPAPAAAAPVSVPAPYQAAAPYQVAPVGFTPPSMTTIPAAPAPGSVPVYAPQPAPVPEFSEEDLDEGDGEDGF